MDEYQKFLHVVKQAALQAENSAEAFNLIEWVRATVPDATGTYYLPQIAALSGVAEYWSDVGCYEDELMPAIALLATILAFEGTDVQLAEAIVFKTQRSHDMMENPEDCEQTYEEFCDKYAELLNA